jgi:hypothetical protein
MEAASPQPPGHIGCPPFIIRQAENTRYNVNVRAKAAGCLFFEKAGVHEETG